jgi:hypothetical protein
MRKETMTIKEFMSRDFKAERIARNKKIAKTSIKVAATSSILIFGFDTFAFATDGDVIDRKANVIYGKLLLLGKWVIIIKGAIDTINNMVKGDTDTAKKSFLGYLLIYVILHSLPWAMNEVDNLFKEI